MLNNRWMTKIHFLITETRRLHFLSRIDHFRLMPDLSMRKILGMGMGMVMQLTTKDLDSPINLPSHSSPLLVWPTLLQLFPAMLPIFHFNERIVVAVREVTEVQAVQAVLAVNDLISVMIAITLVWGRNSAGSSNDPVFLIHKSAA